MFQFCSQLENEIDTIRSEYWKYISRTLTNKYGTNPQEQGDQWADAVNKSRAFLYALCFYYSPGIQRLVLSFAFAVFM